MFSTRNFELDGEVKYGYHGSYTICMAVSEALRARTARELPLPDYLQAEVISVNGESVTCLLDSAAVSSLGKGSVQYSSFSIKSFLDLLDDWLDEVEIIKVIAPDFGFECSFHAGAVVANYTANTAERVDGFAYEIEIDGAYVHPDVYKRALSVGVPADTSGTCRELLFPILVDSVVDDDYSIFKYGITGGHFVKRVDSTSVFFADIEEGKEFLCVGIVEGSPFSKIVPRALYDKRRTEAVDRAESNQEQVGDAADSSSAAVAALPSAAVVYVSFDDAEGQYIFRLGQHMIGPTGKALSGQTLYALVYLSAYARYNAKDQWAALSLGTDGSYVIKEMSVDASVVFGALTSTHYAGILDRLVSGARNGLSMYVQDGRLANLIGVSNENCFALSLAHLFVNVATGTELAMPFDHLEALCALTDSGALATEVSNGVTSLVGTGDEGYNGKAVARALPVSNTRMRQDVYKRVTVSVRDVQQVYDHCADGQYAVFGFDRSIVNVTPGSPDHYIVVKRLGEEFVVVYDPLEFARGYKMGTIIGQRILKTLRDWKVVVLQGEKYGD